VSDYETTQRKRNVIVGFFVVAALCAVAVMIYAFGDLPAIVTKFSSFPIFVQFPSAPGVQIDTPVRFCGYQIGRVTKVMAPEIRKDSKTGLEYHQTVVVLSIDNRYVTTIPSDVEVKLMTRGLGSSYIELKVDPTDYPELQPDVNGLSERYLVSGTWLQGSKGMSSEFFPEESQKKLEELVDGLTDLIKNANEIIGDPNNKQSVKTILANLTEATDRANDTMAEFEKLAAAGTETLEKVDGKADTLVASMVQTSEELGKTASEMRLVLEKINNGEGSVARLVNDGRLYESLLENTEQLQILLQRFEALIKKVDEKGLHTVW
jgi:phospholipid/cholesterol/gamma-HCH transport system substrate-binding protein